MVRNKPCLIYRERKSVARWPLAHRATLFLSLWGAMLIGYSSFTCILFSIVSYFIF